MDFCGSDNGDGCGRSFPQKSLCGLCAKCTKLATFPTNSPEYEQFKSYKQCELCGIAWKNLESAKCARCSANMPAPGPSRPFTPDLAHSMQSLAQIATETAQASRSHAMDVRLKKQPLHTTAGLSAAKSGMNAGENKVFIIAEYRVKSAAKKDQKTTDPDYGQWGKPWPKEAYLSEVLDEYLKTLNIRWANDIGMELIRDEVEFRWSGNKIFLPGDANRTVGEVYNIYQAGDMAHYYGASRSRSKKASGAQPQLTMALELYIDKPKFLLHCKLALHDHSKPSTRKRSATITEYVGTKLPHQKRHAAWSTGTLVSTYVQTKQATSVGNPTVVIQLQKKAYTTCDVETGEICIQWPDNASVQEGVLGENIFASGATKNVHELSIGSDRFVAKRFFEIGSDEDVTAVENKKFLESELIRLKTAAWFLEKFKVSAKEHAVEYSSELSVSDGFIVHEIGKPSAPSSFPPFEQAVWLIEPCCTKSVQKFSGTLVHPTRSDKVGLTLSAFAHFVYEFSGNQIVFADIQGSPMTINGRDNLIIFDPMSHSHEGDSGIGNHGVDGINAFVAQHRCNYICWGLKLKQLSEGDAAQPVDSGDSEDEEDQLKE